MLVFVEHLDLKVLNVAISGNGYLKGCIGSKKNPINDRVHLSGLLELRRVPRQGLST